MRTLAKLFETEFAPGEVRFTHDTHATTLDELGYCLPHGYIHGGVEPVRTYSLRTVRAGLLRKIGAIQTQSNYQHYPGKVIEAIVARIVEQLGDVKSEKAHDHVSLMVIQDILTLYLKYKEQRNRGLLHLKNIICQKCGFLHEKVDGLIGSCRVHIVEPWTEDAPPLCVYRPIDSLKIRGEYVGWLVGRSATWNSTMSNMTGVAMRNAAELGMMIIAKSIRYIIPAEANPLDFAAHRIPPLSIDDMDDLADVDVEKLSAGLGEMQGGVEQIMTLPCAKCTDDTGEPTKIVEQLNLLDPDF